MSFGGGPFGSVPFSTDQFPNFTKPSASQRSLLHHVVFEEPPDDVTVARRYASPAPPTPINRARVSRLFHINVEDLEDEWLPKPRKFTPVVRPRESGNPFNQLVYAPDEDDDITLVIRKHFNASRVPTPIAANPIRKVRPVDEDLEENFPERKFTPLYATAPVAPFAWRRTPAFFEELPDDNEDAFLRHTHKRFLPPSGRFGRPYVMINV